jgi:hypothetical protein
MNSFLLDLWQDLREKRLWPVALVLLLSLVAVPVVLSKPAKDVPPASPSSASVTKSAPEDALASVKLDEDGAGRGSDLGVFDPADPFRPPSRIMRAARVEAGSDGSTSGPSTGATPGVDGGSTSGGSGAPSIGGGSPTTGGTPVSGGEQPGPKTTQYRYVIDVTFTANGRTRRIRGMERLDMLPSEPNPLLIFLGVSAKGGNAVFLVDSTLDAAGEGNCEPSGSDCAFVHIGPGSEHEFMNEDGDSYTLRIDEIRRVKAEAGAAKSSSRSAKARASVGTSRRFVPPLISDLVSVSSDTEATSTNDSDRR